VTPGSDPASRLRGTTRTVKKVLSRLVTMVAGSKLTDGAGQAAGDADDFIPIA